MIGGCQDDVPCFSRTTPRCRPIGDAPNYSAAQQISSSNEGFLFISLDYHHICVTSRRALLTRRDAPPSLWLSLLAALTYSYVPALMPPNYSLHRRHNWTDNFNKIQLDFRLLSFPTLWNTNCNLFLKPCKTVNFNGIWQHHIRHNNSA